MISGSGSGSSLPPAPSRKRKWNAANITRINFGDSDSNCEDVSTAVVEQVTWDGRRIERMFHSVPVPCDPQPAVESYNYTAADNMDFEMDVFDGTHLDEGDPIDTPGCVCPCPLPWFCINNFTG